MTNDGSRSGRRAGVAVLCAALLAVGCAASDIGSEAPLDTTNPPASEVETHETTTDPAPSDSDSEVFDSIQPFLSSPLDDGEFSDAAVELFGIQRIIDTGDLRAEFIGLAGGPADRLDDVDLDAQFVLVATTGQCVIPITPPTLRIGADDATVVEVDESGDVECYRALTVVHFFAVDLEYRDRFPDAIDHLDRVISATGLITSDAVTPGFLDQISVPTFVEGDADHATLASEVTDEDTRTRVTSFDHQTKLLVPVSACDPTSVTARIRLSDETSVETVETLRIACDDAQRAIAVFTLGDGDRDLLRSTAPATWADGLVGDSVIVTPSGGESIFVGEAAVGETFDELETHRISTQESLAGSTVGSDIDFDVTSTGVDLDTQFVVVVVRRDCRVLDGGNGIIIRADSWEISPPLPDTLDCDLPNVAIMVYVIDRQYLGLFDELPEGRP